MKYTLKLALLALEGVQKTDSLNFAHAYADDAIAAIKEALAQPEQDTEQQATDTTNHHIVFDLTTHRVTCTECEASELLSMPIPVKRMSQWFDEFTKVHARCAK